MRKNTYPEAPLQTKMKKHLSLIFGLILCLGSAILPASHVSAATNQAVIGMPFAGKWAWNASVMQPYPPYVDSCPSGASNCAGFSSHPSVHHTPGAGDWATDVYAAEGTAVKLDVTYQTGTTLTFSWKSVTSCGQSTAVNVIVDGTTVGWIYFAHINSAVTTGAITNGMTLGTVHDWGANCNPGVHVHTEFKNTTNHSCYADNGAPGVTLAYGDNLAVLGSNNTAAQDACTSIPVSGGGGIPHGTTTIGAYDPATAYFYERNSNTGGGADWSPQFGNANWIPIAGDWDNNGTVTPGVYDPTTATFYLRESNTTGPADIAFQYGNANWIPIA
ncbi:MAG TPA: hypothetical protein VGO07_03975, partial [Candidatus Saccharimonadales bacterium]|nr:hypothetical protein [Candidatus Saccharimonadales bacterium]